MSREQVIVVEGKHDEQKLQSIFPGITCIVTNGSSVSQETLHLIEETSYHHDVVLFLDPDFPGKQITNKILETNGHYQIAFLPKAKAISSNGRKVGIEHADKQDIINSLTMIHKIEHLEKPISTIQLIRRGLTNATDSKAKRDLVCKELKIPFMNAKALAKTLSMLNISLERIDEIIGGLYGQ
ncbi:MAG: ribonuclease M5 [Bacilli bacterium]|nr:ribonuclease M5 [Bacilli bacterium]